MAGVEWPGRRPGHSHDHEHTLDHLTFNRGGGLFARLLHVHSEIAYEYQATGVGPGSAEVAPAGDLICEASPDRDRRGFQTSSIHPRRFETSLAALYPSVSITGFRLLWLGMLPSLVAFQIGVVATGYAAVTLSDSALAVGLVSGAWGLPVLLLPIAGGVAADRYPRRFILLTTHAVICAAWVVCRGTGVRRADSPSGISSSSVWSGDSVPLMTPARIAYAATAVGPDLVQNASCGVLRLDERGIIVGPVIGGLILSLTRDGLAWAYVGAASLYLLAVAILSRLPDMPTTGDAQIGPWTQLVRGLGYIRSTPPIPRLIVLAAAATLFGVPYVQLMPIFADRVFGVGAAGLGLLLAAGGLGALAGSVAAANTGVPQSVDPWQRVSGSASESSWWRSGSRRPSRSRRDRARGGPRHRCLRDHQQRARHGGSGTAVLWPGHERVSADIRARSPGSRADGLVGRSIGAPTAIAVGGVLFMVATLLLTARRRCSSG